LAGLPKIYKRYQGQYARSITAAVMGVIAVALCHFTYTMLDKYVPTGEERTTSPANVTVDYKLNDEWNDGETTYPAGTRLTQELLDRMREAKVDRFRFQAVYAVPNALYIQYGVPSVLFVVFAFVIFRLVNGQKFADFLIATEGEMKKVSWSSKQELIGSTIVVIATVAIMAGLIYVADFSWAFGLKWIGVLP
jgi:preprotein translocase SecE subunit